MRDYFINKTKYKTRFLTFKYRNRNYYPLSINKEETQTFRSSSQLNSKEDRLVKHTLQPNESKSFPLRSLIANPLPGEYSLFAHNQDGSESSMNLEVQPQ